MIRDLQRSLATNELIDVIYIDRKGNFSQRRLKLLYISGDLLRAYCYHRHSIRSFDVSNILAIERVCYKKEA